MDDANIFCFRFLFLLTEFTWGWGRIFLVTAESLQGESIMFFNKDVLVSVSLCV